ncbi:P-loop NTPase fold protein [Pseudomonas sp. RGM 3321]|uniref:KAP family P-loop NTPase fold protein n=1 Tax=Pseudomonas sp. RGM 3321 TaxID=2930089 RepID=UPI001FCB68FB|nr:P-loop NTPase fold protein [Pseudomonas sp. RGM 3321]MCJ2374833.1 KAP family NTPase [Pseudomonas sp. RGM 3321]
MNRKGVAKFLSQHLDASVHIKVLNVNSEWGSGKTFFLQAWHEEQHPIRPCIYFDAWKHDYSGDPFVSLVATIREQLQGQLEKTADATKTLKKFTASAAKTLVAATPVVAKGLVKKYLAVDSDAISEAVSDSLADAAEKAVEHLISSNKDAIESVDNFKKIFIELLSKAKLKKGGDSKPAYIFIDELDRCRPTYAIELLERIKHLFDISECKFIIASDTKQLAHSINAVYGQSFESRQYLKRFFDAEFSLDNSNPREWIKTKFLSSHTQDWRHDIGIPVISDYDPRDRHDSMHFATPVYGTVLKGEEDLNLRQIVFLALAQTFGAKLRELEKIVFQIQSLESNVKGQFHFFWGAYLVFLKDRNPELYWESKNSPSNETIRRLKEKYQAAILYFGDTSISVHDIFHNYLNFFALGASAARENYRRASGQTEYVEAISRAFGENYSHMSAYYTIVDLAHNLE